MAIVNKSFAYNGDTLVWNGMEFLWSETIPDPRYLTLTQTKGGTVSAIPLSGYDGTTVTLSNSVTASDYRFDGYAVTGATLTGNTFNFTGGDVTAKANFTYTASAEYYSNPNTIVAYSGHNVTLTADPPEKERYSVIKYYYSANSGQGAYTVTHPSIATKVRLFTMKGHNHGSIYDQYTSYNWQTLMNTWNYGMFNQSNNRKGVFGWNEIQSIPGGTKLGGWRSPSAIYQDDAGYGAGFVKSTLGASGYSTRSRHLHKFIIDTQTNAATAYINGNMMWSTPTGGASQHLDNAWFYGVQLSGMYSLYNDYYSYQSAFISDIKMAEFKYLKDAQAY